RRDRATLLALPRRALPPRPRSALVRPRGLRMTDYAELQITTNFSFLRSGSHPEELALTAAALGHAAFAVTDRNSLAGVVRAHKAAQEAGIRFIVGCR